MSSYEKSLSLQTTPTNIAIDTSFLLLCGFGVFLMQPGFLLLETGLVRRRNASQILMKNVLDFCVSSLVYYLLGFALSYGGTDAFIGVRYFALHQVPYSMYTFAFFQLLFATTAVTIVSGAVAERMKTSSYLLVTACVTGLIYPVVVHWTWGGGYLSLNHRSIALVDFSGSGVVHVTGGTVGLIGAIMVGPRKGRFDEYGDAVTFAPSSMVLTVFGAFLMWMGFFPFNAGSVASLTADVATGEFYAARSALNTTLAGVGGTWMSLMIHYPSFRKSRRSPHLVDIINSGLAGLVAICASAATAEPWAAFVIGAMAAVTYCLYAKALIRLQIDDPLNAVAVHMGAGLWGLAAYGLLGAPAHSVFYSWTRLHWNQFAIQIGGGLLIATWAAAVSFVLFFVLDALHLLRSDEPTGSSRLSLAQRLRRLLLPYFPYRREQHSASASASAAAGGRVLFLPGPNPASEMASTSIEMTMVPSEIADAPTALSRHSKKVTFGRPNSSCPQLPTPFQHHESVSTASMPHLKFLSHTCDHRTRSPPSTRSDASSPDSVSFA